MLLSAIQHDPLVGVRTTSAAWALGRLKAEEATAPLELLLARYPDGFLARHIQAALDTIQEAK